MGLNNLSLKQTLFYLNILQDSQQNISAQSLNSISISIYNTILNGVSKELIIEDLNSRLNDLLANTYRDEFTFGLTAEDFPNLNPQYYDKIIYFRLERSNEKIKLVDAGIRY